MKQVPVLQIQLYSKSFDGSEHSIGWNGDKHVLNYVGHLEQVSPS